MPHISSSYTSQIPLTRGFLSDRRIQLGLFVGGCAILGCALYHNYDSFINSGKTIFTRSIQIGIEKSKEILPTILDLYIKIEHLIHSTALKIIGLLGSSQILSSIAHLSIKRGKNKFIFKEILLAIFSSFAPLYLLSKLKKLLSLMWKIGIRNDSLLIWKFLWQCPGSFNLSKEPRENLQAIVTSNPWKRFGILKTHPKFKEFSLEQQLTLANYPQPKELAKIVSGCGSHNLMLEYCSKYPELYSGGDQLSFPLLLQIGNTRFCEEILQCLCYNSFLWRGDQKLSEEDICRLIFDRSINDICILKEWLSFFKYVSKPIGAMKSMLNLSKDGFKNSFFIFIKSKVEEVLRKIFESIEDQECVINIKKFLDDPDINVWNQMSFRQKEIDEENWKNILESRLNFICDRITLEKTGTAKENLKKFCTNCLITKDALYNPKKIAEMKSCIDIIFSYFEHNIKLQAQNFDQNRFKQLQIIFNVVIDGGKNCPDATVAALIMAENLIKMFSHDSKYRMNVIMNMFKLHCIQSALVDRNDEEQVETFIYYLLEFKEILGTSLPCKTMLHPHKARKEPLGEAFEKLLTQFTAENLIKFTAGINELLFELDDEIKTQVEVIKQLIGEASVLDTKTVNLVLNQIKKIGINLEEKLIIEIQKDPESNDLSRQLIAELNNKKIQIENDFYSKIATNQLLKSGYLSQFKL